MAEPDNNRRFPKGRGGPAKGPGWGGPAKGASTSRIKPGDPDGITALRHDPDNLAVKAERRRKALQFYEDVLDDPSQHTQNRLVAADKLLDRIEGKPLARQDVTTKGERIGYVVAAPEEDESPEAWQARQQPTLQ